MGVDSSYVSGFDYLCGRQELMEWGHRGSFVVEDDPLLGGFRWLCRNCPLAVVGLKRSSAADKNLKILRTHHLASGDKLFTFCLLLKNA